MFRPRQVRSLIGAALCWHQKGAGMRGFLRMSGLAVGLVGVAAVGALHTTAIAAPASRAQTSAVPAVDPNAAPPAPLDAYVTSPDYSATRSSTDICYFRNRGDYVHKSSGAASGH